MPNPQISPTRVIDGVRHVWDGSQWVIPSDAASPRAPMITLPPRTPSGRTDANDRESATWLLKNLLMTGGMIAGGSVSVPAMLGGAALGRMAGHIPEALITRATGVPNDDTFANAGMTGAEQGLEGEMAGRVAGPILSGGGRVLKFIGKALGDDPAAEAYTRARVGGLRSWLGHSVGMPGWATAAAAAGPPMASEAGRGLEAAGEAIGSEGLSSRIRGAVDALKARTAAPPVLTHAEEMAQGAEGFAAGRRPAASFRPGTAAQKAGSERADVLSQAARGRASGVTPADIAGEAVPVQMRTPESAVGFEPAPAGAGDFPSNAELIQGRAVQRRGDALTAVDKIVADPAFPVTRESNAGLVQALQDAGVPRDAAHEAVYGVNFSGQPQSVDALRAATARAPEPVAAGGPANLTPDELVTHYETTTPPVADAWRETPGGFDVNLTGPTVVGGPADQAARNQAMRDSPPQDAVAELARRLNSRSEGEMAASRMFKGTLDNEFASNADQITVPEPHLNDALTYLRSRLKK